MKHYIYEKPYVYEVLGNTFAFSIQVEINGVKNTAYAPLLTQFLEGGFVADPSIPALFSVINVKHVGQESIVLRRVFELTESLTVLLEKVEAELRQYANNFVDYAQQGALNAQEAGMTLIAVGEGMLDQLTQIDLSIPPIFVAPEMSAKNEAAPTPLTTNEDVVKQWQKENAGSGLTALSADQVKELISNPGVPYKLQEVTNASILLRTFEQWKRKYIVCNREMTRFVCDTSNIMLTGVIGMTDKPECALSWDGECKPTDEEEKAFSVFGFMAVTYDRAIPQPDIEVSYLPDLPVGTAIDSLPTGTHWFVEFPVPGKTAQQLYYASSSLITEGIAPNIKAIMKVVLTDNIHRAMAFSDTAAAEAIFIQYNLWWMNGKVTEHEILPPAKKKPVKKTKQERGIDSVEAEQREELKRVFESIDNGKCFEAEAKNQLSNIAKSEEQYDNFLVAFNTFCMSDEYKVSDAIEMCFPITKAPETDK